MVQLINLIYPFFLHDYFSTIETDNEEESVCGGNHRNGYRNELFLSPFVLSSSQGAASSISGQQPSRYLVQVLGIASCTAEETLKSSRASILRRRSPFLSPRTFSPCPFSSAFFLFVLYPRFSISVRSSAREIRGSKFPEAVTGEIILERDQRTGNQRNDARQEREKKDRSIRNRERTGNLISRIAFALNRVLHFSSFTPFSFPFHLFLSPRPPHSIPLQPLLSTNAVARGKRKKKMTKIRFPSSPFPSLIFNELRRSDGFTESNSPRGTFTLVYKEVCVYVESRKRFIDFGSSGFEE